MALSIVRTFTDPDAYYAAHRTRRVEGFITESGNFRAELTIIDFDRLWMTRGEETLARVLNLATDSGRTKIWFPTSRSKPSTHLDGLELSPREIGVFRGPIDQHRSSASSDWGAMSLTHEDLAAGGQASSVSRWPPHLSRTVSDFLSPFWRGCRTCTKRLPVLPKARLIF